MKLNNVEMEEFGTFAEVVYEKAKRFFNKNLQPIFQSEGKEVKFPNYKNCVKEIYQQLVKTPPREVSLDRIATDTAIEMYNKISAKEEETNDLDKHLHRCISITEIHICRKNKQDDYIRDLFEHL